MNISSKDKLVILLKHLYSTGEFSSVGIAYLVENEIISVADYNFIIEE